ncbi:hypothetical protein E2C01_086535 [Portunus trituberculatus]|uniref:Uncharacterized protein n=1 Tax=Portunus trituberculatus TaxID=210409 RepID=A0A5B7J9Y5_PORTR|nr:hypothetical protein [Portunus trituberculatus]
MPHPTMERICWDLISV